MVVKINIDPDENNEENKEENKENECTVCYVTYNTPQVKYKCSNERCTSIMCDNCYSKYIQTNTTCAYCRENLIITNKNNLKSQIIEYSKKYSDCLIVCGMCILAWYVILIYLITIPTGLTYYKNVNATAE